MQILSGKLTAKQEFIFESLQEIRLIVGAVGIPARGTASSYIKWVSCCNAAGRNARSSYSLYILLIYNITDKLQFTAVKANLGGYGVPP